MGKKDVLRQKNLRLNELIEGIDKTTAGIEDKIEQVKKSMEELKKSFGDLNKNSAQQKKTVDTDKNVNDDSDLALNKSKSDQHEREELNKFYLEWEERIEKKHQNILLIQKDIANRSYATNEFKDESALYIDSAFHKLENAINKYILWSSTLKKGYYRGGKNVQDSIIKIHDNLNKMIEIIRNSESKSFKNNPDALFNELVSDDCYFYLKRFIKIDDQNKASSFLSSSIMELEMLSESSFRLISSTKETIDQQFELDKLQYDAGSYEKFLRDYERILGDKEITIGEKSNKISSYLFALATKQLNKMMKVSYGRPSQIGTEFINDEKVLLNTDQLFDADQGKTIKLKEIILEILPVDLRDWLVEIFKQLFETDSHGNITLSPDELLVIQSAITNFNDELIQNISRVFIKPNETDKQKVITDILEVPLKRFFDKLLLDSSGNYLTKPLKLKNQNLLPHLIDIVLSVPLFFSQENIEIKQLGRVDLIFSRFYKMKEILADKSYEAEDESNFTVDQSNSSKPAQKAVLDYLVGHYPSRQSFLDKLAKYTPKDYLDPDSIDIAKMLLTVDIFNFQAQQELKMHLMRLIAIEANVDRSDQEAELKVSELLKEDCDELLLWIHKCRSQILFGEKIKNIISPYKSLQNDRQKSESENEEEREIQDSLHAAMSDPNFLAEFEKIKSNISSAPDINQASVMIGFSVSQQESLSDIWRSVDKNKNIIKSFAYITLAEENNIKTSVIKRIPYINLPSSVMIVGGEEYWPKEKRVKLLFALHLAKVYIAKIKNKINEIPEVLTENDLPWLRGKNYEQLQYLTAAILALGYNLTYIKDGNEKLYIDENVDIPEFDCEQIRNYIKEMKKIMRQQFNYFLDILNVS